MSGGTWDYHQHWLRDLAEEMRVDRRAPYWEGGEGEPYRLRDARHFVAGVLNEMETLVKELDWDLTSDSAIKEDEGTWIEQARERIVASFRTWPGRCGVCGATTERDSDPSAVYCAACERSAR